MDFERKHLFVAILLAEGGDQPVKFMQLRGSFHMQTPDLRYCTHPRPVTQSFFHSYICMCIYIYSH